MERANALASLNGKILAVYSARTIGALRASAAIRVALPYVEPVLALNVEKEIRKDAIVIRHAGAAAAQGVRPDDRAIQRLFAATKAVDDDFLARTEGLPVRVVIRYEEIQPLRVRRIRYLLEGAYRLLCAWQPHTHLRAALIQTYPKETFEILIALILDLYAREARALSASVKLPAMLAPLRERVARYLTNIMSDAGARLAHDLAHGIYPDQSTARRVVYGRS